MGGGKSFARDNECPARIIPRGYLHFAHFIFRGLTPSTTLRAILPHSDHTPRNLIQIPNKPTQTHELLPARGQTPSSVRVNPCPLCYTHQIHPAKCGCCRAVAPIRRFEHITHVDAALEGHRLGRCFCWCGRRSKSWSQRVGLITSRDEKKKDERAKKKSFHGSSTMQWFMAFHHEETSTPAHFESSCPNTPNCVRRVLLRKSDRGEVYGQHRGSGCYRHEACLRCRSIDRAAA